ARQGRGGLGEGGPGRRERRRHPVQRVGRGGGLVVDDRPAGGSRAVGLVAVDQPAGGRGDRAERVPGGQLVQTLPQLLGKHGSNLTSAEESPPPLVSRRVAATLTSHR